MPKRVELDEIADDLYSRPPAAFTATRNARAREARDAGDVALADALQRMHRPTVAAWLANLLVRQHPQEVARLLALGVALREAQAAFDGAALRRLSEERHDVVGGLCRDAQRLADERNQSVSDAVVRELEKTLEAGLFDPEAAGELQRGRLTRALTYSGIGFSPASQGSSVRSSSSSSSVQSPRGHGQSTRRERAPDLPGRAGTRAQLASALRDAQREARDARRAARRATTALATAERAGERERAALSAAEAELARRRETARAAQRVVARARANRDEAEREARRAEQRTAAIRRRSGGDPS